MIFSLKVALLALVSVAAAQSSTTGAEASGSSSSTAIVTPSSSTLSAASSTSTSSSGNATSSGVPLPSGLPPSITPCIINCVSTAAQENGCTTFTNLTCVCTSTAFQTAAASCLMANCTPADVTAATNLQMTQCAAIVGSSGASSMAPNTRSNTASGSGTRVPTGASTTAPASTTTNGAQISAASGIWALVAGLMGITAAAL